jgi:glycosyltransferase involved in cell wall biosynthesis
MKIVITADPAIPVPPIHYGGVERIIDMLIKGLISQGHEVTLFAHVDSAVDCKLVPYPAKGQNKWDIIRNTLKVSSLLKGRYDLVHSFGRLAYLSALLPTSLPKIMSYQREPTLSQVKKAVKLSRKDTLWFTGCSEYIACQIRPIAPSTSIPNGVSVDTYTFQPIVSYDAPLVFLGRIEHIKGPHLAIEAARKSGRRLIIAGNIPADIQSQNYFRNHIQPHLKTGQVEYIGSVNDTQKNQLLGNAFALLMPILWNEPFGIVMAEALACGTPVIGFKRGAVPEVIQDGINGYLCNTIDDMVFAINRASRLERSYARLTAEEKFSSDNITEAYIKLYKEAVNR